GQWKSQAGCGFHPKLPFETGGGLVAGTTSEDCAPCRCREDAANACALTTPVRRYLDGNDARAAAVDSDLEGCRQAHSGAVDQMVIDRQQLAADGPDKHPRPALAKRPVGAAHLAAMTREAAMGSEVRVERIRVDAHAADGERLVDRLRAVICLTGRAREEDHRAEQARERALRNSGTHIE